jgi:Tfp pilus assembly protein PilN
MKRKHLNFIPAELRPKMEIRHEILPLGILAFALLYAGGWPLRIALQTRYQEKQLVQLEASNAELEKKLQDLNLQVKPELQTGDAFKAIQKVLSRKNYWSEIFKEMSVLIPDDVWLTKFSNFSSSKVDAKVAVKGAKSGPGPTDQLLVQGESPSQMAIARFLGVLEQSHYFAGARMISSEKVKEVKPAKYRFEFTIPVKASTGGKG